MYIEKNERMLKGETAHVFPFRFPIKKYFLYKGDDFICSS